MSCPQRKATSIANPSTHLKKNTNCPQNLPEAGSSCPRGRQDLGPGATGVLRKEKHRPESLTNTDARTLGRSCGLNPAALEEDDPWRQGPRVPGNWGRPSIRHLKVGQRTTLRPGNKGQGPTTVSTRAGNSVDDIPHPFVGDSQRSGNRTLP